MYIYDPISKALGLEPIESSLNETLEELLKQHPPSQTPIKESRQAKDQWADADIRALMIEKMKERYEDPEYCEYMYERLHANTEIRAIRSKTCAEMIRKPETKEKIRQTQSTPEWKAYFKEVMNAPDTKAKQSKNMLKRWSDTKYRAETSKKHSERQKNATIYYCEVCDKYIKTDGNWALHLRSKKHAKNIPAFSCSDVNSMQ
jgi:hypothetical protein